jgi:hypothetical protein
VLRPLNDGEKLQGRLDLLLLLEVTGLQLARLFFGGAEVALEGTQLRLHSPFEEIDTSYAYTVLLRKNET